MKVNFKMIFIESFFPGLLAFFCFALSSCVGFTRNPDHPGFVSKKIFHVDADFKPIYFNAGLPRPREGLVESIREPKHQNLQNIDSDLDLFLSAGNGFEYGLEVVGYASLSECEGDACTELSERRAKLIADRLLVKGLKKRQLIRAIGLGTSRPLGDEGTEVGQGANRRVEIYLVKQPSPLPGR